MNLGQLFSGAGRVATGMQEAEATARLARQNQLIIEEQNRLADLKARMAQAQLPSFQQVQLPQFTQPVMPGQQMPMETVAPAAPAAPLPRPDCAPANNRSRPVFNHRRPVPVAAWSTPRWLGNPSLRTPAHPLHLRNR